VVLPFLPGENLSRPVRQPVFEVTFGGATDPWERGMVALVVETGLAPAADVVEVYLSADEQAPAVGDTGSVSLGYEDDSMELVFTGEVESVLRSVEGETHVTATNGGAALSKLRLNRSYEQRKAGDIVRDLAGGTNVGTDAVEGGAEFPFYVVDDRQSAYRHIAALARKSDYLARFTPENRLNFAPFTAGQPVQTFAYGVDILSLRVADAAAVVDAVTTVGEGAAGSQGADAWSWLVKDPAPVTGSAGGGEAERQVQDGSLRSRNAAQSAADGIANAAGRMKLTGELLVPGSPAVVVGSAIESVESPQDALNGLFLVRGVRHRFSKAGGFTTLIRFSKTGDGGLGGLL
jgi:phage protein D